MFQLIVFFFIVTNGVTAEEPAATLKRKIPFATQELCMNYFDTEQGRADKAKLDTYAESKGAIVKAACNAIEDNSI